MPTRLAVIGGRRTRDRLGSCGKAVERLDPVGTPFGHSETIFRCQDGGGEAFLFLCRHGPQERGQKRVLPWQINYRANLYALRELGVEAIVSWSSVHAVSHNFTVGQLVAPDDLIDETRQRNASFFEEKGLDMLRQWPVFCPSLRGAIVEVLRGRHIVNQHRATLVCTEGIRMHTPAEVRKFASFGGDLLGHWLAPEAFLARELMMSYASLCFVEQYAETGSPHRPFEAGGLFGESDSPMVDRVTAAVGVFCEMICELLGHLRQIKVGADPQCAFTAPMRAEIAQGRLPSDWRQWFD
ncbi:MAG: S-methyl-5'-thioadenosine phosphorylase [Phycisphaerae bacterium]|nr:S-methyl-5'-thioadenosine phosphorylase [Phycisphaerae bacterium]